MELLEAIFGMFGDSIISGYFNLIENTVRLNEDDINKRKNRLKRMISVVAGVIFLLAFVSLMLSFVFQGLLRNLCLFVLLICIFIVLIYILLGFILKSFCKQKNKK